MWKIYSAFSVGINQTLFERSYAIINPLQLYCLQVKSVPAGGKTLFFG
uniref:Uncharacterized protein n=1 Tax=Erwinia amylovora ATCC BAA-2158 TaxID=889211 RepID=E5B3S9_ERWAM|nr:hypothetical protein predicted by Glimmer/Critica [Erwinia amylovora ATCC BAA-2158]